MEKFLQTLLNPTENRDVVEFQSLRQNRNKQMARVSVTKKGLSDIFVKMQVSDDKISCTPLTVNGEFL